MKLRSIYFLTMLLTVCVTLGSFFPAYGQLKIGYINSNVIMAQFKDAVEASKKSNEFAQELEKERQQIQSELETLRKEFDAQQVLLSEERKSETMREIQDLYQRLLKFQEEKFGPNGELERRTKEFTDPVVKKIQSAIDKLGRVDGFDFIFDTVNANIVFAREKEYDLTERVLAELNKGIASSSVSP